MRLAAMPLPLSVLVNERFVDISRFLWQYRAGHGAKQGILAAEVLAGVAHRAEGPRARWVLSGQSAVFRVCPQIRERRLRRYR